MTSVWVEGVRFDLLLHQHGQLSNQTRYKGGLLFILELNGLICRVFYTKTFQKKKHKSVVTYVWPILFSSIAFWFKLKERKSITEIVHLTDIDNRSSRLPINDLPLGWVGIALRGLYSSQNSEIWMVRKENKKINKQPITFSPPKIKILTRTL